MRVISNPEPNKWQELIIRPSLNDESLKTSVAEIMNEVKLNGDEALKSFSKQFDKVELENIKVTKEEIDASENLLSDDLKSAIKLAYQNINTFHTNQVRHVEKVETAPGVVCWREQKAIEKVGLYIPGGSAPLFSSLLMLGIPAKIAGSKEIVVCTPPQKDGSIHPAILYTAKLIGLTEVFKVGGAQSIAALAYGTSSIPAVYKIFGPGNQYVTIAKTIAQGEGIAIDMPAGPSEVLVIGDDSSNPAYIAADLLSQAEHGPDSQVVFVSNSSDLIEKVKIEVNEQLKSLPRRETAAKALDNSLLIRLTAIKDCIKFSNLYAPEHLIIATENPSEDSKLISNAGSVFIGKYSCESAGDYASGTNHTLPTNAFAKNYSGVSVDSFCKSITYQELSEEGVRSIGKAVELMSEAEGLIAHKNAMSLRLKDVNNV